MLLSSFILSAFTSSSSVVADTTAGQEESVIGRSRLPRLA